MTVETNLAAPERRFSLVGTNYDRPQVEIRETVWASSATEAVYRASLARRWLNKIPAHKWVTTGGDEVEGLPV